MIPSGNKPGRGRQRRAATGSRSAAQPVADPPSKEPYWRQIVVAVVITVISGFISALVSGAIMHISSLVLGLSATILAVALAGAVLMRYLSKNRKVLPSILLILPVIGAAAIGAWIGRMTANPATGSPPPHVTITSPASVIQCASSKPQCQFEVTGRITPEPPSDLKIVVLVYPENPSGGGWFVQWPDANLELSGDWHQTPAYIGSTGKPVRHGNTLEVEAVVVHANATYNGIRLKGLEESGKSIPNVRQIKGLVSHSNPVNITVT